VSKLLSYLRELHVNPRMETFSERKRLQKLAYLLQAWGLDVPFDFGWYLHGPYSRGTTQLLFEIANGKDIDTEALTPHERERITKFARFLGDDLKDPDKLEVLASIHFLRTKAKEIGASENDIRLFLKRKKPYFTDQQILTYWQKSVELDSLPGLTP
jgi:uncharacterized protein YwgA